jgi:LDH2 family malate/lactate/ureidoglycolate dehydrogenase
MKRNGHFTVPLKKSELIIYQESELDIGERLAIEFKAARGLKARVAVATEILKSVPDITRREVLSEIIALRNAGHVGRIGAYSEQAVRAGLISIHFVNVAGSVLVAPFGGTERRFSTAPFSVGVPTDPPVVLDFATSAVAEGKVLVASNGGKALPKDALIEPDGTLSGDPHTLYGEYEQVGPRNPANGLGAIRAFGEHKGSGLAFMCELLAGAFTGGGCSGPISERGRIANGMLSIFISPKHFGTEAAFKQAAEDYVGWVKSCKPAVACGEVLKSLLERRLVRITGRAEELGRPMLYGTTTEFLKVFGLSRIEDLPQAKELRNPQR